MKDKKKTTKSSAESEVIDLRIVFRTLWRKKWFFVKVWVVTFILACVYIFPQPRIYETSLALAPEMGGQSTGGTLSSLASNFGIDLGGNNSEDAFYPELYPDLMSTNEFLVDLLYVRVKTIDDAVDTTYLAYLTKFQKKNPLSKPFLWMKKQIMSWMGDAPKPINTERRINPRRLTKEEDALLNKLRSNILCDVDIKTNVITISVKDQDPLICATIADSACARLQSFITEYRTSKARIDLDYYQHLVDSAKIEYDASVRAYSAYCDSHQNIILQAYVSERDELENTMQAKLSTYNAMQTQLQVAKAKVQERTPAFTVLHSASVPVKATSPKRMMFVIVWLFLSFLGACFWIFRKSIGNQLLGPKREEETEHDEVVVEEEELAEE